MILPFVFLISQSLLWDAPDDARIQGFRVYDLERGIMFDAGPNHSFDLTGILLPGAGYQWVVTSYSSGDESEPTPVFSYQQPYPASRLEVASAGTLIAYVYPGLTYAIETTSDLKTWTTMQTFFADIPRKKFSAISTNPRMFFRLREMGKPAGMMVRAQSIPQLPPLPSSPIPAPTNVKFRDKLRNFLKYKPGHAPKMKKGSEMMTGRNP